MSDRFWETTPLEAMTPEQWESLCDGCGRCCLHKLEDEDTGEVVYTRVACKLLDLRNARCSDYPNRLQHVPGCVRISPVMIKDLYWLPRTCAYRLLAQGEGLYDWHPLVSGDPRSVVRAGISVVGRVLPEDAVDEDDLEDHVVRWIS